MANIPKMVEKVKYISTLKDKKTYKRINCIILLFIDKNVHDFLAQSSLNRRRNLRSVILTSIYRDFCGKLYNKCLG